MPNARPMLPGTPTALVLVTSRNQLTGLVATDGAHPLTLDLLSTVEARELLARRLPDRVVAEPVAAEEIIACCARLPLALTIAAARAEQSNFPLTAIAAELADTGARLDKLDAGDLADGQPQRLADVNARFTGPHTETPLHWVARQRRRRRARRAAGRGRGHRSPRCGDRRRHPLDDAPWRLLPSAPRRGSEAYRTRFTQPAVLPVRGAPVHRIPAVFPGRCTRSR
jgi:hypothetical protein